MFRLHYILAVFLLSAVALAIPFSKSLALPALSETTPRDYPGIHNAVAFHEKFISGSAPEGDVAFDALAAMGVKTIITVDGAVPEVAKAESRGMRYIHLPIGYDGIDEKRQRELARAVRDAMAIGPVYLHCHHGKHRSAGAASTVAVILGWSTPDAMIERMKIAGTSTAYTGLFACARHATPLSKDVIDAVPADFPSISRPTSFVQCMIDIDDAFDHLKAIARAEWKAPRDHPDLVPAAEAGRLTELLRHLAQSEHAKASPAELRAMMHSAHEHAQRLEAELASPTPDRAQLANALEAISASCRDCHTKHRD